ncbi:MULTISPECIES: DJ-1/PfpI family protein [Oceanobacillus]|uniref:DJ-1/PfpI family protein n=1 Tax=Oceanobacillus TaxID=182709 RepID=UPI00034D1963|nr:MULTISPECIES: DJ-1/PfpI family protein [Oceanobacillus]MBT2653185.1 DJ-1/PfpI family protein [Oceanobacillus sp. ISL-73]MCT1577785.1 DJ-1/PfpI family protein [Oceanobacillus kimchii]MCT2136773.1 DJ-1/PfpI family protein [Oceanobacillus kimchii]OEH53901.1 AraC family transcriptional regulator [Oceanobacillus sp. E9]
MSQRTVGILLFNEVEVLDFAGPFEVFSITTLHNSNDKLFNVSTISENGELVTARNGLKVYPDYSFVNHPSFDIVIIPGGYGAEEIEISNPNVINWIKNQQAKVEFMTSVCTGALLLAKAGILDGKRATTHWMDLDRLEKEYSSVLVQRDTKFIDEGSIITSGGISAGINMSFHLISRLHGIEVAKETAKRMEYDINL